MSATPPSDRPEPGATTHPALPSLEAYVGRALSAAAAVGIELHLGSCATCRYSVNEQVLAADPARAALNLLAVSAEIDAPRRGVLERSLVRMSVSGDTVRLMVATPSLRRSWFIAIGVALFFGLSAANPDRPDTTILWFLGLAPLIPVIGVALAYGPGVDPAYEITLATPVSGFRLVLIRATAVFATSIVFAGLVSLLMLPRHTAMVGAWILPAFALSLVCLALMTVLGPKVSAAVVASGWLAIIIGVSGAADQLVVFRGSGQIGFAAIAALAASVIALRRRSFDVTHRDVMA